MHDEIRQQPIVPERRGCNRAHVEPWQQRGLLEGRDAIGIRFVVRVQNGSGEIERSEQRTEQTAGALQ